MLFSCIALLALNEAKGVKLKNIRACVGRHITVHTYSLPVGMSSAVLVLGNLCYLVYFLGVLK